MDRLTVYSTCVILSLSAAGCGQSEESKHEANCQQLRQMEISQLDSRNTIDAMNQEHSSETMQSALDNADDALDILQEKILKECPIEGS